MMILPSSLEMMDVPWNQVEKLAGEICCSISASAFFQTSYILFSNLLRLSYYSTEWGVFHRKMVENGMCCNICGLVLGWYFPHFGTGL